MTNKGLHPVLYLLGICLIVYGLSFPFCIAYMNVYPKLSIIVIILSLLAFFLYYLYIFGENRKERKEEIVNLLKENIFMRCSYNIFMMGLLTNVCIMISKKLQFLKK